MSIGLDLAGSVAKVERATHHLDTLEREAPSAFSDKQVYTVRFSEVDPQTGWCEVFLVPQQKVLKEPHFGIAIGDIVHNLRSALDYIVTSLVDASSTQLSNTHKFPIYKSITEYNTHVGDTRTAKGKGPLAGIIHGLGLIEQLQPYHRKPDPTHDPLWVVHRFSNADKHREVASTIPVPLGTLDIKFEGTVVEKAPVSEIPDWSPDGEHMIHRMRFDPPVAQNLKVEGPLRLMLVFSTPAFGAEPSYGISGKVLRQTCDHVRMVVNLFEKI